MTENRPLSCGAGHTASKRGLQVHGGLSVRGDRHSKEQSAIFSDAGDSRFAGEGDLSAVGDHISGFVGIGDLPVRP